MNMKRSAIFCIFVLLAGLNSASSAQAIFGLSKCEKIKHQMLKAEKSLSDSLTYLSKFEGQEVTGRHIGSYGTHISVGSW